MLLPKAVYRTIENTKDALIDIPEDISRMASHIGKFILDNPETVAACVGIGISLLRASRSLVVSHRVAQQNHRADFTFYDPHSGFRWDLKRKLTNNDRMIIGKRIKNGEDMYDILKNIRAI